MDVCRLLLEVLYQKSTDENRKKVLDLYGQKWYNLGGNNKETTRRRRIKMKVDSIIVSTIVEVEEKA